MNRKQNCLNFHLLFVLTFISVLTFPVAYGKNTVTDTAALMKLVKTAALDPVATEAILKLDSAVKKCTEAGFPLGAATALYSQGSKYNDIGEYDKAVKCAEQALPTAAKSGDPSTISFCHNLLGTAYFFKGNYALASSEYFTALDVLKKIDSLNFKAALTIYSNLAALYGRMNQPEKVRNYLETGENIARDKVLTHGNANAQLATLLVSKGNYFERNHSPDSATACYLEVLDILKMPDVAESKRTRLTALALMNIGACALQKGDYSAAAKYAQMGIDLAKGKYAFIVANGSYILGEALRKLKRYKEAESILLGALRLSATQNTKDQLLVGYGTLVNVYKDSRNFEKALIYTDSLQGIKDSLYSIEKEKAIAQFESKYLLAEKNQQLARNELIIEQQKNNNRLTKFWLSAGIAAVSLLSMLFIAYFYFRHQKQQLVISALEQKNTISVLKGVVQGEENERIRLARDLHDGIGGMLSATKMRFMALRHQHKDLNTSPRYMEAMGLLDVMGDEIRKTSHNLMPETLLKQELPEALRNFCNEMKADASLQIDFQSFGNFGELLNDFKLNVYRIVQELLKNVVQHAHATYVVVQLMRLDGYLTLNVEDNGAGFDTEKTSDGIGLQNLRARVSRNNGHITVRSTQGSGTTVLIEFELANTK